MLRLEPRDGRRQHVAGDRLSDGEPHAPSQQAPEPLDLRADVLELAHRAPDVREVELPGGRGANAARQAFEERRAELLLEIEDPPI